MIVNKISSANVENAIMCSKLEVSIKEEVYKASISFSDVWNYLKNEELKDSVLEK